MSRIGQNPIKLPQGVTVEVDEQHHVHVKGVKGTLVQAIDPAISVAVEGDQVTLSRHTEQKKHKALHGLSRALIHNMVIGVHQGFEKRLELIGVGYKAHVKDNVLELSLGYSHKVCFVMPPSITAKAESSKGKHPILHLQGVDKQLMGQVSAKIKSLRKPEPYKGKGIKFVDEQIRRKVGKKAAK